MVDQFAIVTQDTPISNTTQDYTSGSITEPFSGAILIFNHATTNDVSTNHGILGIGLIGVDGSQATNTLQVAICASLEHGKSLTTSDNDTARDDDSCFRVTDGDNSTTLDVTAAFDSAISGGFRLNFTQTDVQVKCTAIIFAGLSKAAVGQYQSTEAGAHEDVGLTPFWEPDVVIFRSSDNVTGGDTANGTMALGFATNRSPILQVSAYTNWDDRAATSDADGAVMSDQCSTGFEGLIRTFLDRFSVTSFDSTGFNAIAVNAGAGSQSPQANYLALKFTDSTLQLFTDNLSVSSSTGVQSFVTGFQPLLVLGMSTLMTSEDTLTDGATAAAAGLFAFNASAARAYSIRSRDGLSGASLAEASSRHGDHAVLTLANDGSVAQQADFSAFTGTGFNLNFTTATAGFLTLLAIGAGSASLVTSDSETISDQSVLLLNRDLVVSDTETITDEGIVMFTTDVSITGGQQGETLAGGAERGTSFQGGAEEGTVM